jgi:UDP-N-acetylglucosamine--N-acetylmuramyl-(pentapeptide) pyrophosphoryl-undecaprenol N-acetylglucosamine transferase
MMQGARVTILAGGTGGHVFPALAVADRLSELGCVVSWVGTNKGIENSVVPNAGYSLSKIPVSGLRGKGIRSLLLAPFQLTHALITSLRILSHLKPQIVLGFGGFVAGPVGLAARLRGDSLAIHEQNARAGTTNRILARWANKVMTGFPNVFDKGIYVGNPVRSDIREIEKKLPANRPENLEGKLNILVLGGSQGARSLNQIIPAALAGLGKSRAIRVRHQCGPRWLEDTKAQYKSSELDVEVLAFIDKISDAYAWSDLVVCRAGAMTVAEVAAMGRPALFVPFPYAIDDHQTANAEWLVRVGGAELIQESDINEFSLGNKLAHLAQPEKLQEMARLSSSAAIPDATDRIVRICEELINAP